MTGLRAYTNIFFFILRMYLLPMHKNSLSQYNTTLTDNQANREKQSDRKIDKQEDIRIIITALLMDINNKHPYFIIIIKHYREKGLNNWYLPIAITLCNLSIGH